MNALAALADPTRRRILELLAEEDHTAGELAETFTTSRPGVSRHLRVLREAGLVRTRRQGTTICYSAVPEALAALTELIAALKPRVTAEAA